MKAVFADAFYFAALLNRADQHHSKATAAARDLRSNLVTTEWVLAEVADALADIDKFKAVRVAQEKQVAALAESVKLSIARYEGGLSSYLEVLDADQQYYGAQNTLARTLGSQLIAYVQLYRALGGGWQAEKGQK